MKYLILLALLFTQLSHAEKVYRWVDQDGITHFSQYPPVNQPAKVIKTPKVHIDAEKERQRLQKQLEAFNTRQEEKKIRAKGGEEAVQYKRKLDQYCKALKRNLSVLNSNDNVIEQGKDKVISGKEKQQKIAQIKKQIAEKCQ